MSNATGTCARCGRGLKDPESAERGFGPVCWARVQAEKGVIKRDEMLDRLKEQELFERGG